LELLLERGNEPTSGLGLEIGQGLLQHGARATGRAAAVELDDIAHDEIHGRRGTLRPDPVARLRIGQ
jgi:hypothetical protein